MKKTIEYMQKSGTIKNLQSTLNLAVKDAGKYGEEEQASFRKEFHRIMMHELSEDDKMLEIFMDDALDVLFDELALKPVESLSKEEEAVHHFVKFITAIMED